jgi:hypothetical protein
MPITQTADVSQRQIERRVPLINNYKVITGTLIFFEVDLHVSFSNRQQPEMLCKNNEINADWI